MENRENENRHYDNLNYHDFEFTVHALTFK